FDFVKQALAPITLSLRQDSLLYDPKVGAKADLWIVSDAQDAKSDLQWQWVARDRRGEVFAKDQGTISIAPLEAICLGKIHLKPPAKTAFGPLFLELRILGADKKIISERINI